MIEAEAMDRTREDDGIDRLDPFVQPPILKAFFEQLPVEELAKCRLVSKLWHDVSLSTWRSNVTLTFVVEDIDIHPSKTSTRDDDGSIRTTSLGEFLDLWDTGEWGSCPFKKYKLDSWNFRPEDVEQRRFLELVGGHITSLTLEECSFVERDYFRRIIYQAFPKLQFLKMTRCKVNNVLWYEPDEEILAYKEPAFGAHGLKSLDISRCHPDSMMDMLSHFHKVKSLHLHPKEEIYPDYRNLLETIRLIRAQDQTKLPLTNFDVKFDFEVGKRTASSMELLQLHDQLNLPLQRLEICFYSEEPEEDEDWNCNNKYVIRDILQYHSSTLKHLVFSGEGEDRHGLCTAFPFGFHLEKLEELVIRSNRFFDNLNYLRYTPNLRVLDVGDDSLTLSESGNLFSNSAQLEIGDWTLPALTDLRFYLQLSPYNMRKLMKWMPNVERLSWTELDDVKFSMVCNNWKNLMSLEDFGEELTDEGVIGIGNTHEADGGEGTQTKRVPNITKLKNLTSFWTCSSKLTSASVHDGFLKLDDLECLALGAFTELDDEAKAALERRKIRLDLSA